MNVRDVYLWASAAFSELATDTAQPDSVRISARRERDYVEAHVRHLTQQENSRLIKALETLRGLLADPTFPKEARLQVQNVIDWTQTKLIVSAGPGLFAGQGCSLVCVTCGRPILAAWTPAFGSWTVPSPVCRESCAREIHNGPSSSR